MSTFSMRVRFAPSPTGNLHIGGLRSALFNFLFARHHKGSFLLRIEDTDIERSKDEYTQSILDAFTWVGIQSDEPVVIQSERSSEHRHIAEQLLKEKKAYRCYCTQDMVVARHNLRHPGDLFIKYDGLCRSLMARDIADSGGASVIRFAIPENRSEIVFDDLICGKLSFSIDQLDDFIIVRSDGSPMYNFVVVADDAFMRISHVIRAQEHIINTPKQILLYEACDYVVPQFAHIPLILGPSGEKMSKRDGATSVLEYRKEGYLPEALLNYLARLGWSHGDQEIFTMDELIAYFSLEHVGKKGAIFDSIKLKWLNKHYIRHKTGDYLYTYAVNNLDSSVRDQLSQCYAHHSVQLLALIDIYKERVDTVKELVELVFMVLKGPDQVSGQFKFNVQDVEKWVTLPTIGYLQQIIDCLANSWPHELSAESLGKTDFSQVKNVVKAVADNNGLTLVQLAQPIRIALQGTSSGPGVFELMHVLGRDEVVRRIKSMCDYIQK